MIKLMLVASGALGLALPVYAGEIGGGLSGCEIRLSCEWKAKGCYKPSPPFTTAYDSFSYNLAVENYNRYVSDAKMYLDCIISEGRRDINDGFPKLVKKSIEESSAEIDRDISSAKSSLEMARTLIRR